MEAVMDWFGSFGAGLVKMVLMGVWIFGSMWIGGKVADMGRKWQGWVAGVLAFLLGGLLLWPAIEAMTHLSCKDAEEYEDCVNGEGAYEPSY